MSNESSASETTPLRRPASQNSEESNNVSSNVDDGASLSPFRSQNNANNPNKSRSAATIVPIASHDNGNKSSSDAGHLGRNLNNNNSRTNMDSNKRILIRVGLDAFILLCVGGPILALYLWGIAYKRGFFCDDESLKHPYHESTVKSWMLYIVGGVIPLSVMLAVEFTLFRDNAAKATINATARRYVFMDYEIPEWMVECYKKVGVFGFGAAVSQLVTDIAKYTIGRLRPHFFTVCQPIMNDGTTCADPINAGRYIQDYTCAFINSTPRMMKEVRLSFPSGHSSFAFFTMVYLALYLQSRMTWRGSKLLRHFLQFAFIMIAWYTSLTRISNYKHHWSDVLAGSFIGSLTAVIVAKYVSDLFREKPANQLTYLLPRSAQDLASQTMTSNGH